VIRFRDPCCVMIVRSGSIRVALNDPASAPQAACVIVKNKALAHLSG
jgi:hypothetical protein